MKKLFIAAALILSFAFTSAYAHNDVIAPKTVEASFRKSFATAQNVAWAMQNDLYVAKFQIKGRQVAAYYDRDGVLTATTRYLKVEELPLNLQSSLHATAKDGNIIEIMEVSGIGGIEFYATVKSSEKVRVLQSDITNWVVYRKERK